VSVSLDVCHARLRPAKTAERIEVLLGVETIHRFAGSENSLCMLFANDARRQLHSALEQSGDNVRTARQLRGAVLAKFFDGSELLLVDYVCCFMRCRVIYFRCLCYLASPPLFVVGVHLTRCVSFFSLCFFGFLFFEAAVYAN